MWSLLEEVVLSSSDLITNFFADHITIGENDWLYKFVNEANDMINSWGDPIYKNHIYSVGSIDINALSSVAQIFVVILSVLFGFCYGVGVYTAQYFGAKKNQHLRDLVTFKIQVTILITLVFIIIIQLFSSQLIGFIIKYKEVPKPSILSTHEEWIQYYDSKAAYFSIEQGTKYLKIVSISYPILALELALITTLRETGRPMTSFWASFSTFILTILFLFFLVEPNFLGNFKGFGLLGCAYSVILGNFFQIIFLVIFIFWKKYEFIPNRIWNLNGTVLTLASKKSIIITINELLWSFSMLIQVKLLSIYSLDSLTANAILTTFTSILLVPAYHGISAGISVLVGNNLGNNELKIAEINSKRLIILTTCLGIFLGSILAIFGLLVGYIFSNSSNDVISLTKKFMIIYSFATPFLMINGTIYSIIRSGGLVITAFLMDSIYNWTITIPIMVFLILGSDLDIVIVFIIIRIIESLKIISSIYFYRRKKWIKNLVHRF